jgi:fucose 4-O-acetylase-like acetyltransferase
MQRQISPDFIRGISIILMVYGHITPIGRMVAIHQHVFPVIYTFHIPLFLLISGFFFDFSDNTNQKIVAIFRKIGIPYFIFITCYILGILLVQRFGIVTIGKPPTTLPTFINTVLLRPFGAYWFLHSLLIIQIVLTLVWGIKVNSQYKFWGFILVSTFIFWLLPTTDIIQFAFRTGVYFLIGILIKHFTKGSFTITPLYLAIIVTLLAVLYLYQNAIFNFSIFEIIWCLGIFAFLWAIGLYFKATKPVKIIAWIGQNTLIILLLHILFIMVFKITNPFFLKIDGSGISYFLVITMATISLSMFASFVLDKLNISKYLFGTPQLFRQFNNK